MILPAVADVSESVCVYVYVCLYQLLCVVVVRGEKESVWVVEGCVCVCVNVRVQSAHVCLSVWREPLKFSTWDWGRQ